MPFLRKNFIKILPNSVLLRRFSKKLAVSTGFSPVKRVYDFIRGLSPYPAAWTEIVSPEGVRTALKIYQAEKRPAAHELPVGTIRTDRKSYIDIAVEDGYLRLLSVQLAGKKRLPVTDFLNGFKQIGEYKVD